MNELHVGLGEGSDEALSDPTYFAFARTSNAAGNIVALEDKPAAPLAQLPQVLLGRYRLERLLGAGGMGAVYRARDLLHEQFGDPDPYIAIKLLSDTFLKSPDASALLYSEFALTRRLHHPNVVRLHSFEVDTHCQRAFITMELMHGLTLDKLLCERPTGLPWHEVRDVALPLLDALAYSHTCGVLHGDLKPSNVMLSERGVRLFDFGLGKAEEGALPGLAQLSRSQFNAWTPSYAAAELLEGGALSVRSDLYALGCVIYELVGGKHPFKRLPATQARDEGLDQTLTRPRGLPRHCWPALQKALSFDPCTRLSNASQLRAALARPTSRLKGWLARCRL
ncbi:serine/threonine protein kinase [Pseudomonas sp. V1]|uniref:serine/threonine-protein kinase n=1 Tax=Pseudomonas arcuscaelestis TaxID=2710591 RepID=UPI00193F4E6D|nr:serine/threonine-protein kinase [Pseudomonas arcuscaelestis]MBM3108118.1 serine/threonine protein kinase [Pseudomonas arcuscaelestis]